MEEKKLIEGKFSKTNILAIISAVIAVITLLYSIWWDSRIHSMGASYYHECIDYYAPFLYFGVPMLILTAIFYFWMSNCSLTITNKRVYGQAAFGKRVDLPFDMISATATGGFNSISVATSSGKISFWLLNNRNEVFEVISNLLIERQNKENTIATTTIKQEIPQSNADELKKYKELLDIGVITQEEFDAKKKQLLGL